MRLSCQKGEDEPESNGTPSFIPDITEKRTDEKHENEGPIDFPEIDKISLYTLRIYLCLGIPLIFSAGFTISYVFTAGTVSYRCLITECEDPTSTILYPSWLSNAVPYSNGEPATCTRYIVQNSTDSCLTTVFTNETENCDAWVYDSNEGTILNEWGLTCDENQWRLTLPGTICNVGYFVGMIFVGQLSDRFGRRNMLVATTLMSTILGLIRSFSINYEMYITFEFLDAVAGAGIFSSAFVLGMEFVGPTKRVLVSSTLASMFVVGEIYLALCAMWLRKWRRILWVFYATGLFAIVIPFLVPESVRWLSSKGRTVEAETVLRKIAFKNGIDVSEKSIAIIRNSSNQEIEAKMKQEETKPSGFASVRVVLGNKVIRTRLLICSFCWIVCSFVYYGLSLRSVTVQGNKYANFILISSVEIPAEYTSWALGGLIGRKPTLSGSFFLSGLFCIATIFTPEDWWFASLIVFLGGKYCIATAFSAIYVYTAEMFPTSLRHSLLGFCSMSARIGSMIAPQMPLLENYMDSLPLLLFGIVSAIASILSFHFPETVGIKLPDTMYEAENIAKPKKTTQVKI